MYQGITLTSVYLWKYIATKLWREDNRNQRRTETGITSNSVLQANGFYPFNVSAEIRFWTFICICKPCIMRCNWINMFYEVCNNTLPSTQQTGMSRVRWMVIWGSVLRGSLLNHANVLFTFIVIQKCREKKYKRFESSVCEKSVKFRLNLLNLKSCLNIS